ncbi:MAG: DNA-binding protein [Comamonadaceae bacterium PBBC2]|nr:MAG: DNA-binding protein [Comamonadaceae bacterium PBBC2]
MRFEGTLKTWNDDRGCGFIEPTQGGEEIFVHIKAFDARGGRPQLNQPLSFEVEMGPQGKKRAHNVTPIRKAQVAKTRHRESPAQWATSTLFAIPAFLVLYVVVSVIWRPPLWIAALYAAASLITFIAYAIDKSAATKGNWRTPESTLHLLALACGWPGALCAQQLLRHKSSKAAFRSVFWATVVLNVAGFVFLCTPLRELLAKI